MTKSKDIRKEKEREAAEAVQKNLFPPRTANLGSIQIEGYHAAALENGGDWWHYCEIADRTFLWIGDATGHGPAAAVITSVAKSVASAVESLPDISPAQAMKMLNTAIYQSANGKMCMTFFIASIDKKSGQLIYCNASHEPPFLIPQRAILKKQEISPILGKISARLGESLVSNYEEDRLQLNSGDIIYFFTDGVTELVGKNGELFEERRLIQSLIKGAQKKTGAKGVMAEVHNDLEKFRNENSYNDDVTYFAVQYIGSNAS